MDFVKILKKFVECREYCGKIDKPINCRGIGVLCSEYRGLEKLTSLLGIRDELITSIAVFENYALWKKSLLKKYVSEYGPGRFKIKRLVKFKNGRYVLYTYLGFERYEDSKVIPVVEEKALEQFIEYSDLLDNIRGDMKFYEDVLKNTYKESRGITRKLAREMLKELKTFKKKVNELRKTQNN